MNPLAEQKQVILARCEPRCIEAVKQWANKDPSYEKQSVIMHWQTYHALIILDGGHFVSD